MKSERRAIRRLLCALLLLGTTAAQSSEGISIGQRFQLDSKRMGEMRSFLVHTPADYAFTKDSYPVLIVLDGDAHFAHASATVDFLSQQQRIPKMIVVGVSNTNRGRDLTPPNARWTPPADGIGGPDKFLSFIGDELIPEIDRRYRTRSYRVIAGHSNGGLFTLYTFASRPELFNGYISISPAFNNEDGLAKRVEPLLIANKALRADLFITMANEGGQNLGGAYEMASLLQEKAARELRWELRRYPEETHGSIPMRSLYDGLQAIFNGWYVHDPFALFEQGGLAGLEKHYAAVSERVGYTVPVPEDALTEVFLEFEGRSRLDEARAVIAKAEELYPNAAYVHFFAARLFSRLGDEKRTVEHATRSLQLAPSFGAPRMLLKARNVDPATIIPSFDLPKSALAAYVGGYGEGIHLEILNRDGVLHARTSQREYTLRAMSDTKFYYVNGEDVLIFRKTPRGDIAGVTLQSTGVELARVR